MIDPIKSVSALKAVQLANIDRVRERIAEIEERFGIAGDNSFQSTLEREMKKAQRADRAQASRGSSQTKAAGTSTVERAVDAVGVANNNQTVNNQTNTQSTNRNIQAINNQNNTQRLSTPSAKELYDAELVSEFDDLEQQLTTDPNLTSANLTAGQVQRFNPATGVINPTPTPNTVREPVTLVEGAIDFAPSALRDIPDFAPQGAEGVLDFTPTTTEEMLEAAAMKYSVDPNLIKAIATAESNLDQNVISPVGAIGVMQLMPETADMLGVNPYDEQQNIEGGAKYLRQMLDTFGGNVSKAIAAYNAGPGAVERYGGVPPYSETQNYVGRVLDLYE